MEKPKQKAGNQKKTQKSENQQILIVEPHVIILPNFYEGDYKGPTDFCNWVIPDRLLMGAYPKRRTLLSSMLEAGVTTFINLMTSKELERIEKYGPYFDSAKKIVIENEGKFQQ